MIRSTIGVIVGVALLMAGGCGQETPPASDGTPAEVPVPGPAADPGPAPAGQYEPPIEDTTVSESPGPGEEPSPQTSSPGGTDEADPPQGSTGEPESTGEDVSLKVQSWDQTEKLIASHQGKVVVVDFWSTSCLPCRREFPHLVELHNTYQDEIACISVSLDYSGRANRPPESYRQQVERFLAEQGATFENVLSSDDPDGLQARLKLAPIPLVWVFDRQGKLARQFDNTDPAEGEFTYMEDVLPYLESLLADS